MLELFIGQFILGLATGSIYACLALAVSICYRSTGVLNFAQGSMATVGAYVAWYLTAHQFSFWPACISAIFLSFLFGMFLQLVLIRPIEDDPQSSQFAVVLGLILVLESGVVALFSSDTIIFTTPFESAALQVFGISISKSDLGIFLFAFSVVVVTALYFRYSSGGLVMRGVAENRLSARLLGIRVRWVSAAAWGMAASIGTVAGILSVPSLSLTPQMMTGANIFAISAAILGGVDSPTGSAVAGIIVGVVENMIGVYAPFVGAKLKLTVTIFLIFAVLMMKPDGIWGRKRNRRV